MTGEQLRIQAKWVRKLMDEGWKWADAVEYVTGKKPT